MVKLVPPIALAALIATPALAQTPPAPPPSNAEIVEEAAKAPLEDLNVVREKIPAVLLTARESAYARPSPLSCAALARAVTELDGVLGEDFDAITAKAETRAFALTEDNARRTGGELAKDAASSLIPFRGWVRKLSGAEKHAKAVQEAVAAGRVRRGYLKGLGQSLGCKAPAAPVQSSAGR
ncbi:MAG: hypothetical protein ACXW3D_05955 [Caulobacteraceae bacterium]